MGCVSRHEEIAQWIRSHRESVASAVVLDDLDLTPSLGSRCCVVVDGSTGLSDADVAAATAMLGDAGGVDALLSCCDAAEKARPAWKVRWEELEARRKEKKKL